LLRRIRDDNIVYHGMAAHYFVSDVAHVLKVRVIADMKHRAASVAKRDGVDEREALATVKRGDEKRSKWSRDLYGIELGSSTLYDLVLRLNRLTKDDAVEIVSRAAQRDSFQTTPESVRRMEDLVIRAEVIVALVDTAPKAEVTCRHGHVSISTRARVHSGDAFAEEVEALATGVPGVERVEVTFER